MRFLISFLAFVAFSVPGIAAGKKFPTLVTCQQDEGDEWVEVGIVQNDGPGLTGIVVEHNDDQSRLVARVRVHSTKREGKTVFQDSFETFKLVVSRSGRRLLGSFVLLKDGPGSISKGGLYCYEKSTISYDK